MCARLVTALLAAALAVSACSDDEPAAGPTLPPITETPSATPTAQAIPTEATAATPEGAAEFVRYFYESVQRAYETADPSLVEVLSAEGCTSCSNFIDSVADLRDAQETVADFSLDVVDVQAAGLSAAASTVNAVVVLDVSEYVRESSSGTVVAREPAADGAVNDVQLIRVDGAWLVQEISQ